MRGRVCSAALALALGVSLTGCAPQETVSQVFAMDTLMTLKIYGDGDTVSAEEALKRLEERIYTIESELSVTREDSFIHKINTNCGRTVAVSDDVTKLLTRTLEICEQTDGALDITAYSAVKAWGFTTGENRVPNQNELDELVKRIDYTQMQVMENGVVLSDGMQIDLGAVAKGYTGDVLALGLREMGIESACLSLGGNVHTVGTKPDGTYWRVGIEDPETGGALAVVEVSDEAVVTSGNYQRYFEQDGEAYWHIIDPDTAAPARSGLSSVTIIGSEGLYCDALSTALFVMGLDEATDFWRAYRDFEAIFVEDDGDVFLTSGLKERFSLSEENKNREVTVLE